MSLPAPVQRECHSPGDIRRPRDVAICLTPFAYLPGACPPISDEARWLRFWTVTADKPLTALAQRLNRTTRSLEARDAPLSDDVEILGRVPGFATPQVLALVAHGLTYGECAEALRELAR